MNQAANVTIEKYVKNSGLLKLHRITKYDDPAKFTSKDIHLRPLFKEIQAHGASDIFIAIGKPISVTINNDMFAVTHRVLDKTEAVWLLHQIAGNDALSSIYAQKAINTAYGLFEYDGSGEIKKTITGYQEKTKYRVNASAIVMEGEKAFQIVMRTIPSDPPDFTTIGLNETFVIRCCPPRGIILIAGVTGSGKSTTLASIIKYILERETAIRGNIVTHEEPIEFTYENIISRHSIIVQSQIPECFASFKEANREAMRRKPGGIVVGELRDRETIGAAVEAALTGHPAFATIHSSSITDIISRIVELHEPHEKETALFNILRTSKMLIAQRLVKKVNGKLMAVQEYLYLTDEIRKHLTSLGSPLEQNVNEYIQSLMDKSTGAESELASQSFKAQGRQLFEQGVIDETALNYLSVDS